MQYIRRYDYTKGGNVAPEIKLAYVLESFSGTYASFMVQYLITTESKLRK